MFLCVRLCLRSLSAYLYVCIFTSSITSYTAYLVCLLQLKPWHLHIFLSWHLHILNIYIYIHMISNNILMNIFMQVFGVCKSYNYITHLSTYAPTRSRANHRLVGGVSVSATFISTEETNCLCLFCHSISIRRRMCERPGKLFSRCLAICSFGLPHPNLFDPWAQSVCACVVGICWSTTA